MFDYDLDKDIDSKDISNNMDDLDNLYREGMQPVYGGTNVSIILATIVLINMAVTHNVSNAYVDELLRYLSTILLLAEKSLPKSHYEA